MSLNDVIEVVHAIALADSMSYWLIGGLTVVAFVLMRAMLPVKGLSFVFAPILFWGGLTGIFAARHFGFIVSQEKSVQIVAAGTFGMMVALVFMMSLVRLLDAGMRIRNPVTQPVARGPAPRVLPR